MMPATLCNNCTKLGKEKNSLDCVDKTFFIFTCKALSWTPVFYQPNTSNLFRHFSDYCRLCFFDGCIVLDQVRCDYYLKISRRPKPQEESQNITIDAKVKEDVNKILFDIAELGNSNEDYDCIPLVSSYTDCNKENICTGCKSCQCNKSGSWNCNTIRLCSGENDIDVTSRDVLLSVMKKIKEHLTIEINRSRRSILYPNKAYKPISEWLYGVPATTADSKNKRRVPRDVSIALANVRNVTSGAYTTKDNTTTEKHKHPNNSESIEFKELLDSEEPLKSDGILPVTVLNGHGSLEIGTESYEKEFLRLFNSLDDKEQLVNKDFQIQATDLDTESLFRYPSRLKRDMSQKNEFSKNIPISNNKNTEKETNNNDTTVKLTEDLNFNILNPLLDMINSKQTELNVLHNIKAHLIHYMKSLNSNLENVNMSVKTDHETNLSRSFFSLYKIEVAPELLDPAMIDNEDDVSNQSSISSSNKTLIKLKKDIMEVIKDVIQLKKDKTENAISYELLPLVHAIQYYVNQLGEIQIEKIYKHAKFELSTLSSDPGKHLEKNNDKTCVNITDSVLKIFKKLDTNDSQSNLFFSLSKSAFNVINRLSNYFYADDTKLTKMKANMAHFNVTQDLIHINENWHNLFFDIQKSIVFDNIYYLKLLYSVMSEDINSLEDVVLLLDFSKSRRMTPVDQTIGTGIIQDLNDDLKRISAKVQQFIKQQRLMRAVNLKQTRRFSFFNKLKNLFKHNIKDDTGLSKKQLKELAAQHLKELTRKVKTQYSNEIIQTKNNDVVPLQRVKRSMIGKYVQISLPRYFEH